jgi:hypothetical protein
MDTFYATMSAFCFTLVGLWWAVVQVRIEVWTTNPQYRRLAQSIHYGFLIPGGMSLGALLSGDQRFVWQGVFIVASLCGMVMAARALTFRQGAAWRAGQMGALLLYALILLVSLVPAIVASSGLGLSPLQATGLCVTAIVVIGANFAWSVMMGAP